MIHMNLVVILDVRYRQRVRKRLIRLRKRLLAFVIKANPECFDHHGRLAPGCFPARIPPEAANLHGLMRRAECKLAMIRCHAECAIGNPDSPKQRLQSRGRTNPVIFSNLLLAKSRHTGSEGNAAAGTGPCATSRSRGKKQVTK
jgi:hypothetical protein